MWGNWIQIHAGKAMTKKEFDDACKFALKAGATMLPRFDDLERGGIVGIVRLVRWSRSDDSPWFMGKFGWVIERPYPLPFRPCVGQLGFFDPVAI